MSVQDWIKTHPGQSAGVGLGSAAGLYLLIKKHNASTASSTSAGTGVNAIDPTTGQPYSSEVAGLTSPNTTGTDYENWLQDQNNQLQQQLTSALGSTNTPATVQPAPATSGMTGDVWTLPYPGSLIDKAWPVSQVPTFSTPGAVPKSSTTPVPPSQKSTLLRPMTFYG